MIGTIVVQQINLKIASRGDFLYFRKIWDERTITMMKVSKFFISIVVLLAICMTKVNIASAREANLGVGKQVAISYVGGFGGAVVGGMVGSSLVYWIAATEEQKKADKHNLFKFRAVYFFSGAAIGYPIGSAIFLHLNDRSSSFPWMVAGALGTELAVTGIVTLADHYDHPTLAKASLWGYLLVPLGAVIAFNQTRNIAPRYSGALLEIQDHKLSLNFPILEVQSLATGQNVGCSLKLLSVRF